MKTIKSCGVLVALALVGTLTGCATTSTRAANVTESIRTALDQAGLKDVSAKHDQERGVVTLSGRVAGDGDKARAETIAKSLAGAQVVSNQVEVIPPGVESEAKRMNSDLDKGIENNLHAVLIREKLDESVKFDVKNHVVTLTGSVDSQTARDRAQAVSATVPNVQQVVNELQIKKLKATSSN
jgi:osmotically-inducible protein OsmY